MNKIRFTSLLMLFVIALAACAPQMQVALPTDVAEQPTVIAISTIPANTASISGAVWHDVCMIAGGEGGAPMQPSAGCIVSSAGGYRANSTREADEAGLGDVLVSLGYGACGATDDYFEIRTNADGSFMFANLAAGTYCVLVDSLRAENALLLPGEWTTVVNDTGASFSAITVTLVDGEQKAGINFGWDYQFLPLPDVQPITPTPIANCVDSASYVADLSIPDGTIISVGDKFVKTWRLRNTGTCTWTASYALVFVDGNNLGAVSSILLPVEVAPNNTVDVSVSFVAPSNDGTYQSKWKLRNASGVIFGINNSRDGSFWTKIRVGAVSISPSSISGAVWSDYCTVIGGEGTPATPSGGCVQNQTGGYKADGLWNNGEAGIGGVTVTLTPGQCPGDSNRAVNAVTGFGGAYGFDKLNAGTYCVSVNPQSNANLNLLIPGEWTFPFFGVGYVTVALGAGENKIGVDFGWDYQFK